MRPTASPVLELWKPSAVAPVVLSRATSMGILRSLWVSHSIAHVAWMTTSFRRDPRVHCEQLGVLGIRSRWQLGEPAARTNGEAVGAR
jgi:hypothetical protein